MRKGVETVNHFILPVPLQWYLSTDNITLHIFVHFLVRICNNFLLLNAVEYCSAVTLPCHRYISQTSSSLYSSAFFSPLFHCMYSVYVVLHVCALICIAFCLLAEFSAVPDMGFV